MWYYKVWRDIFRREEVQRHSIIDRVTLLSMALAHQVWGEFRKENYRRHRIIGRVTLLSMALAMLTAARYALFHLAGDSAAEKVRLPCTLQSIAWLCSLLPERHCFTWQGTVLQRRPAFAACRAHVRCPNPF